MTLAQRNECERDMRREKGRERMIVLGGGKKVMQREGETVSDLP